MKPKDIGKAYDQITDRWLNPQFNRSNGIAQHQRALAFVKQHEYALDVGCGCSGRFIDLLCDQGFTVEGVDISEKMIRLARQRHPDIPFHHADICQWTPDRHYDFITAWDSIWHVPLASQELVMKKLLTSLRAGGVCIFTTGGVDVPDERSDSFMGPEVTYCALGIPRLLEVISLSGCVCRHLEYDQFPELHLYVIAQRL